MQTYSTTIVIDSLLKSDEINNTIDKIQRSIKNNGGLIEKIDHWGKKRLTYEIKKRQYGYYVEILFKATGDIIKIIEREYGLDENILRYLTIKLDKQGIEYYNTGDDKAIQKKQIKSPAEAEIKNVVEKLPEPQANDVNSEELKTEEEITAST